MEQSEMIMTEKEYLEWAGQRITNLEAENVLLKAECEGVGSVLLDVQQECIELRKELDLLRIEGARADDC